MGSSLSRSLPRLKTHSKPPHTTMLAVIPTIRVAARTQARAFSLSALRSSEGMPSGHGSDSFKKREKGQEDAYVRDAEKLAQEVDRGVQGAPRRAREEPRR